MHAIQNFADSDSPTVSGCVIETVEYGAPAAALEKLVMPRESPRFLAYSVSR